MVFFPFSGDFPFFFNEIQDVFKPSYDDTIFHAIFSTNANGLHGSAICSFDLGDIEEVFEFEEVCVLNF